MKYYVKIWEFDEPYVYYDNKWYCLNGKLTVGGQVLLWPEEWMDAYYYHNVDWRNTCNYVEASNDDMAFGVVKDSYLEYQTDRHEIQGCPRLKELPPGEKAYYFWEEERTILKKEYTLLHERRKGNISSEQAYDQIDKLRESEQVELSA